MILYINACVWEDSRTNKIAKQVLSMLDGKITEIKLKDMQFPAVNIDFLSKRDHGGDNGDFSDSIFEPAKQFALADTIVVAAPYWDLSFPASLKTYLEQINVVGISFEYSPEGIPVGLCKAKKLYYITTSGGDFAPDEYGYGYVEALAKNYYGIPETKLIKATGLDLYGADPDKIVEECIKNIEI